MLLLAVQSLIYKEDSHKKYLFIIFSFEIGKIIFALGYKVIAVYIGLTLVYIRGSNFKDLLYRLFYSLSIGLIVLIFLICNIFCLYNYFENLMKIIFDILKDLRSSKARFRIKKFRNRRSRSGKICYRFIRSF